ncbi:MAG TPA: polyamine ABC transporter substrate-binding protein [Cyanobacteria bacterium UBA12227]|nr:polyamine ABC transporter substrate-binding protein [Cyanobacteria bacterium UBA12227]HAX87333.1 polyamine ABC transporter substrate-binding protein [Cyanobacteria bacterium UBA11370]
MKRRSFLVQATALGVGQLALGCSSKQPIVLNVQLLQDSIPAQLLGKFRKTLQQSVKLNFEPEAQLQDLYKRLETWKRQAAEEETPQRWSIPFIGKRRSVIASLVTLGDYWLETAIRQNLIEPLELSSLSGWQELPSRWQTLVKRNRQGELDESGVVWGAPYRWGSTVIAYNRDKFKELGWIPKDWSDLWHPELRDRISLLDQPREVIGLTLKKLGFSYNQTDLTQVPDLKAELLALQQQAKFYSSDRYLEPLVLGDTWVAVGWSTDILALRGSDRQIEAVVPQSGTALWADLWVQPASVGAKQKSVSKEWIDFCWQQQPAIDISLLTDAASPLLTSINPTNLPNDIRENSLLLPNSSVLDKSEFLYPLPKETLKQYETLWAEIRKT